MEAQKYKIYINGTPLILATRQAAAEMGITPAANSRLAMYAGRPRFIIQYMDLLEKNRFIEVVVLWSDDLPRLWADFQGCFKVVEAAGGYVENERGELLVMFRRGSWDLPKGKLDPGETPAQAAVREVQEETGLKNVGLNPPEAGSGIAEFSILHSQFSVPLAWLCDTYHTYIIKGKRHLKKTYWFRMMQTTDTQTVPQTEEDIEEIRWVQAGEWLATNPVVYPNIRDVLLAAQYGQQAIVSGSQSIC